MAFGTNPAGHRLLLQMKFYWGAVVLLDLLLSGAAFALQWHTGVVVTKTVNITAKNTSCLALAEVC